MAPLAQNSSSLAIEPMFAPAALALINSYYTALQIACRRTEAEGFARNLGGSWSCPHCEKDNIDEGQLEDHLSKTLEILVLERRTEASGATEKPTRSSSVHLNSDLRYLL